MSTVSAAKPATAQIDPAPTRDWIYQASNPRFGYIRPKNKHKPFDFTTAYAITLWLRRSFGVEASFCSDGLISLSGPIPKDINRYGFRGLVNPHRNYSAGTPSSDPINEEILRSRPSRQWITATFGEGFAPLRTQVVLAEYVEGLSDPTPGTVDPQWLPGLRKLDAIDGNRVDWPKVRDGYQAYKKTLPGA